MHACCANETRFVSNELKGTSSDAADNSRKAADATVVNEGTERKRRLQLTKREGIALR